MDKSHDQNMAAGAAQANGTNAASPRPLFGDDAAAPAKWPTQKPAGNVRSGFPKRLVAVVLPLAILLVGIAAIAWVTQYLPGRGRPAQTPTEVAGTIQFESTDSVPKAASQYIPEFELGVDGYHDFHFTNTNKGEMELGIG